MQFASIDWIVIVICLTAAFAPALFGTGAPLYGQRLQGALCLTVAAAAALGLVWVVPRIWGGESAEQG